MRVRRRARHPLPRNLLQPRLHQPLQRAHAELAILKEREAKRGEALSLEPEPETAAEPEAEASPLAGWLAGLGLQEHLPLIENYVSDSSQMADLRRMLEVELEDEESGDTY